MSGELIFTANISKLVSQSVKAKLGATTTAKKDVDKFKETVGLKISQFTPVFQDSYPLPPYHGGTLMESFMLNNIPATIGSYEVKATYRMSGEKNQNAKGYDYAYFQESGGGAYKKEGSQPHFLKESMEQSVPELVEFVRNDFYLLLEKSFSD